MKSGVLNLAEILTSRKSDPCSYIQLCKKNGGGGLSPHPRSDACDLLIERCKYKHAGNEGSDCCRKKSQKLVMSFFCNATTYISHMNCKSNHSIVKMNPKEEFAFFNLYEQPTSSYVTKSSYVQNSNTRPSFLFLYK